MVNLSLWKWYSICKNVNSLCLDIFKETWIEWEKMFCFKSSSCVKVLVWVFFRSWPFYGHGAFPLSVCTGPSAWVNVNIIFNSEVLAFPSGLKNINILRVPKSILHQCLFYLTLHHSVLMYVQTKLRALAFLTEVWQALSYPCYSVENDLKLQSMQDYHLKCLTRRRVAHTRSHRQLSNCPA